MSRVAAIDCGTNSIRLLIADVTKRDDGTAWLRDVHREMKIVRLGQGVDATGRLHPDAIERTRQALLDYARTMQRKGVETARMVATSATRDASNRDEFFSMTEQILGAPAEVITGDEEARLSYLGAVADLDPDEGPFLVTDLGGGSTEFVLGTGSDVEAARSMDIGCVRLTERFIKSDPPTEDEIAQAEAFARAAVKEAFEVVPVEKTKTWIGVAGTVTTLSALVQGLEVYNSDDIHLSRITLDNVREITDRILSMTHDERASLGPMHPGRVDVICGGAVVLRAIADELENRAGIRTLVCSEHDILDGIAFSLV
ncbi:Ppx/GppA phosphatase family protein [Lentzea flaviverrucosa]|uniref:Exopolyphosphatase / guanosine-5'-triphosphate,3'-diphosphate pyrophosphatase n=1 Tax=Lentzea flaviverrucosa TaxID=200379 RepID=A0A1H9MC42_9PSEU|nr:Ppx/GppA phosphatase family protein [Lentzea flaviverrucosa]RDI30978.1 exopolyphosphatase/guanosine-5'-triphosphate,3'-diphosphate pyrophosphatase [Lentzea flaviverrucosa]SER21266.1 exopolyphosphatase / guanosine-5'-triphosphate,3'-diphosphate pyrophosphatase [Lentzea flaviverrucosa]